MLTIGHEKHHKNVFNAPETFSIFKGKWYWQLFHSMKAIKWGFEHGGHKFNTIQSLWETQNVKGEEEDFGELSPVQLWFSSIITQSIPHVGKIFILARFFRKGLLQRKQRLAEKYFLGVFFHSSRSHLLAPHFSPQRI